MITNSATPEIINEAHSIIRVVLIVMIVYEEIQGEKDLRRVLTLLNSIGIVKRQKLKSFKINIRNALTASGRMRK